MALRLMASGGGGGAHSRVMMSSSVRGSCGGEHHMSTRGRKAVTHWWGVVGSACSMFRNTVGQGGRRWGPSHTALWMDLPARRLSHAMRSRTFALQYADRFRPGDAVPVYSHAPRRSVDHVELPASARNGGTTATTSARSASGPYSHPRS